MDYPISLLLLIILLSGISGVITSTEFCLGCRMPENAGIFSLRLNLMEEEQEQLLFEGRCFLACATEEFSNEVKFINYQYHAKALVFLTILVAS